MNLAQTIDPNWVQAGCPQLYPPHRPAGLPEDELRVVDHGDAAKAPEQGYRNGLSTRLCKLLDLQHKPLTVVELWKMLDGVSRVRISTSLKFLSDSGRVLRSGVRGSYAYELTQNGREYIG